MLLFWDLKRMEPTMRSSKRLKGLNSPFQEVHLTAWSNQRCLTHGTSMGKAWPAGQKPAESGASSSTEDGSVKGGWVAASKAGAFCWQQKQHFVGLFLMYFSGIQDQSGTAPCRAMGGILPTPSVMGRSARTRRCHGAESSRQYSKGAQKHVPCS